jgi:membrane-associated phospholipid phosphatase
MRPPILFWLASFLVCAGAVALSFVNIDVPVAMHFSRIGQFFTDLNAGFGASVILTLEAAVASGLALARVLRGHLSRSGETLAIACIASICTYCINDAVLKPFFGVPVPIQVLEGARHTFNLLSGSEGSSFPSGHMTLAGAFAGVFMRLYRRSVWPFAALLGLAAGLLIAGDWHFVSDVIAGTFVGVSAGVLAGEAWIVHSKARP